MHKKLLKLVRRSAEARHLSALNQACEMQSMQAVQKDSVETNRQQSESTLKAANAHDRQS